LTITSIEIIF